jgi:hypothetical protein
MSDELNPLASTLGLQGPNRPQPTFLLEGHIMRQAPFANPFHPINPPHDPAWNLRFRLPNADSLVHFPLISKYRSSLYLCGARVSFLGPPLLPTKKKQVMMKLHQGNVQNIRRTFVIFGGSPPSHRKRQIGLHFCHPFAITNDNGTPGPRDSGRGFPVPTAWLLPSISS